MGAKTLLSSIGGMLTHRKSLQGRLGARLRNRGRALALPSVVPSSSCRSTFR